MHLSKKEEKKLTVKKEEARTICTDVLFCFVFLILVMWTFYISDSDFSACSFKTERLLLVSVFRRTIFYPSGDSIGVFVFPVRMMMIVEDFFKTHAADFKTTLSFFFLISRNPPCCWCCCWRCWFSIRIITYAKSSIQWNCEIISVPQVQRKMFERSQIFKKKLS